MLFTIDFVGLLNSQQLPLDQLAKRCGYGRGTVRKIIMFNPTMYHRVKVGVMLRELGVSPYPPLYFEPTDDGPRLSVDWDMLLDANGADVSWLIKKTRQRYIRLHHMLTHDPVSYVRDVLGATLYALDASLYPPFFIESENEIPRGPYEHHYTPARKYYRARSRAPNRERDG